MGVVRILVSDVPTEAAETLGLPESVSLMSREGLAASVRRAASFACPTTAGALVRATNEVLCGLPAFEDETPEQIARVVEGLVAYGDLLELPVEDEQGRHRQLFLGYPAYVPREGANKALLIGIRPEGAPLLSEELMREIEYSGHARSICGIEDRAIGEVLEDESLAALRPEQWLKSPRVERPDELLVSYIEKLETVGHDAGDVELRVIDPESSVTYYRGRWRALVQSDSGYFVGRRPQGFGADLWCFVQTRDGTSAKIIDLPLQSPWARGADEAWRLQAALDALKGQAQRVRVTLANEVPRSAIEFFSPVPSWLQRRLDFIGVQCAPSRGALFAYEVNSCELPEELDFLKSSLWMAVEDEGGMESQ